MKKIVFTIILAFIGIAHLSAQKSFGIKAGLNVASINGDNTEDFSSRTSFTGGLFAEFPTSEKIAFQLELLYSEQGAKYSVLESDETLKLNYLNIPLMFKYYATEGFSIQAGPQIGFLLSAKVDDTNVKDFMTNVDFGLNFGLGYKLKNGLSFDARYNLGLTNIWETYYYGEDAVINNKNRVWQITLGYAFKQ